MVTDRLMSRVESRKILLIKEMAEGAVSGIMEEPSQAKEFIYIGKRGEFCFENLEERGIKPLRESPGDMQGPKGVLKTSMLGRGKYPASTLQLEDASKALNPGGVDHIPFCFLPFDPVGHHNVMINGVCDQSGPLSVLCLFHVPETFFHESLSESSLPFSLPPGCLNFTFPAPTSRRAITMGRLSASTNGLAPFMIIFALLAARITSSKRLSTFLRQSSTVILAILFLPLSLIFFEDQMLTPSTPFCKDDRL